MAGFIELAYLVAASLFIVGLKRLATPATARGGNFLSALGMLVAIVATLFDRQILGFQWIVVGVVIGSALGLWMARAVKMTAMPQMVGILNGFGGGASQLVAAAVWHQFVQSGSLLTLETAVSIYAATLIGGVTFSGSIVAAGKLQEIISGRPVLFRFQHLLNLILFLSIGGMGMYLVISPGHSGVFIAMNVIALILGVLVVIPIGGADMPVVICLLNSYSGLAAATTGFVISNHGLIISGALVGASGIILTQTMCLAMNRSFANVLFGGFGAQVAATVGDDGRGLAARGVRETSAEDAAVMLGYARSVVVAPGYGLAVAQAQHQVRDLADLLEKRGVTVKYAIHPVAGRMPGHMNVLLAEANVPYPQLFDMEQINPEFERTDVVLVVGANDVVNPAARNSPSSPIYGMPILDVDKAGHVIVLKRSMNPGFAGIENELFYNEKTFMLFGDARESLVKLVDEVKNL
ncbi:MAG: NAD(P)(+) transhydrogenase (Re/Si-specific) subunit beta [candidate division NC10 bacterium]|nr:NAD(P)(+) transhydrogenase (Re/Si-specific) subunit beta [candidate division NC10 bacterium]